MPREASWSERGATIAMFAANGFGFGAWASSIPYLKALHGLSDGMLSLVLLALVAGAFVAMPVAGFMASRLGSGLATRATVCGFALCLLLPFSAPGLAWLFPACFLLGATNGALDVCMNVHASAVEKRWGAAIMSSFHACWSAAGLAGAAFSALVLGAGLGPAVTLTGAAVLTAALAALFWSALRSERGEPAKGPALAFPARAALALCLAVMLAMLTEGAVADWSGVYLATVVKTGASASVAGYAVFTGAMVVGRIFGDGMVRSLGQHWVLASGGLMAGAGLLLAAIAPSFIPSVVGFGLAGFGLANLVPTLFSAGSRVGPTPAAGVAMAATAGYTGHLSGPPLMGGVATLAGLPAALLVLAAFGATIAVLSNAKALKSR